VFSSKSKYIISQHFFVLGRVRNITDFFEDLPEASGIEV
jgi:hypothetical protein